MIETLFSLAGRENVMPEVRSSEFVSGLSAPAEWLWDALGAVKTDAGVAVNETVALNYATVFACIRVLSETLASMPLIVYRQLERGREKAPEHYAYRLLKEEPNPEISASTFIETLMQWVNRWGNAYALIEWNRAGRARALWPLAPQWMRVQRVNGRLVYSYEDRSSQWFGVYPAEDIIHIRTLGDDLVGWSPIRLARQAIGAGMAAAQFGAKLFANGAKIGGILQVPGRLKDRQRFIDEFNKAYASAENAHKTLVIDDGAKWVATTIPPDDAQFLETRKFQRSEIAAIYRVPPHLIGDLERATFSNIEHQSLEFIQYSMLPWMTRFEQEFNRKLLGEGYFCKFLVAALLRGDMKSRYEAYNTGLRAGFLCQNEVRELEEMNPVPGGDVYRVQAQMVPLTQLEGGES